MHRKQFKLLQKTIPDEHRGLFFYTSPHRRPVTAALLLSSAFLILVIISPKLNAAPNLEYFFPAGATRGQEVNVRCKGKFGIWPVQFWIDRQGLTVTAQKDKGKIKIQVDADAVPGVYWIRFHDDSGASALKPFIIGVLPAVIEKEPNDQIAKGQTITRSSIIDGRLGKKGDVDIFAIDLKKGQTLVASMLANRILESPMDAILQVVDPRGNVLDQNDEGNGYDPLLVFTATADGPHMVRTFAFPTKTNSTIGFAGAENFIYRLTLTTGPYIDYTMPMVVPYDYHDPESDSGLFIVPAGPNMPTDTFLAGRTDQLNSRVESELVNVWHPQAANFLPLPLTSAKVLVAWPDDNKTKTQTIPIPSQLTGRLALPGQIDTFTFQIKKGQSLAVKVAARTLGFPIDPIIRILDAKGKILTEVDDTNKQADPSLVFKAPADGKYRLTIGDRFDHGGARYVYRIHVALAEPDFALNLAADHFELTPGKTLEIPITIQRHHKFGGTIAIKATDLPDGVTATAAESKAKGATAKAIKLKLTATQELEKTGAAKPIRIVGFYNHKDKSKSIEREATFNLTNTGRRGRGVWLTVIKKTKPKEKPKTKGK